MEEPLAAAYQRCRELHRRHGRSYYLATRLLPAWKRRHVHALYGFARYADDIVDQAGDAREAHLKEFADRFHAGVRDDPILPAVLHTIAVFDLDRADFAAFLDSMAMDLTVTGYRSYHDLLGYMAGSAAAIGTMMLPILEPTDLAVAREPARQLGFAFQLTNFIRDIGEDLGRGRLYLPQEDLDRFGVTRHELTEGVPTRPVKNLIAYEIERARTHYGAAAAGIPMLAPTSRACIRTAFHLYQGILDEVERADYDVFTRRATVPVQRRLMLALRSLG